MVEENRPRRENKMNSETERAIKVLESRKLGAMDAMVDEDLNQEVAKEHFDAYILAISALQNKSGTGELVERLLNAVAYAEESQDFKRAISIISRILDGMTDAEIIGEDNMEPVSGVDTWIKDKRSLEG